MGRLSRMKSGLPTCNYLWSGMLLLAVGMTAAIAADISLGSVVRFNTTCAMCHEAECSGRLSFDLGQQASDDHIRRYAGDEPPAARNELRALLEHMKRNCVYYPISLEVPQDKRWRAAMLAVLRSAAEDTYFVPLGELAAGRYRAALRFDGPADASAQVISASFDSTEHTGLRADDGTTDFVFGIEHNGSYFLRLKTDGRSILLGLEAVRMP